MVKALFMGNIDRVKYRFGREYMPEVIVKTTEKVSSEVIHETGDSKIVFKKGEIIHFEDIGDVMITDIRRYSTGEIIYDTDYDIKVIEDEITELSLKEAKQDYTDYQELREKVLNQRQHDQAKENKEKSFFEKTF